MNCANHPEIAATAYCRTCGKPLCASCTRDVQGVIYCENCLAERLQGVHPPQQQATNPQPTLGVTYAVPQVAASGPNPALAGILAGFFPFGVGAVYTGQYAKGLAHLVVMTLLIWGETVSNSDGLSTILAFGIAFFYVYQIIDAVKSAHAIRAGQAPPDPFGLAGMFGAESRAAVVPGSPIASAAAPTAPVAQSKIPTAAVVLIGLGVLFLLKNSGVFDFDFDRIWPLFLIGLGGWLIAVRLGYLGSRRFSSRRGWVGPVVLITIGTLSLMERMGGPEWHRTWPILLLAIGVTRLLEGKTTTATTFPPAEPINPPVSGAQTPTDEVKNG